jgi:chloride channel 7
LLGLLAGLFTTYYGPGASGSGVAELIGYMNGINYPDFLAVNTQITKILGVTMAVASRLCIGKEGPLAHIGAIWGAAACYFPGRDFQFLQNDEFKRQIIAAGASAGVSAAFGAPIGGTLFAYEMSKPTVFWTFEMIWRTFTCCSVAVLVLALLQTLASGNITDGFRGSTIKFGAQLAND